MFNLVFGLFISYFIHIRLPVQANEFKEAYEAAAVSNGALSAGGEAKVISVIDGI